MATFDFTLLRSICERSHLGKRPAPPYHESQRVLETFIAVNLSDRLAGLIGDYAGFSVVVLGTGFHTAVSMPSPIQTIIDGLRQRIGNTMVGPFSLDYVWALYLWGIQEYHD